MPKALYIEFVGIDVSKNKLDVYETKNNQHYTVTNNKKSIRSLFSKIKRNEQQLVLGGYEAEAVKEFTIHGYKVHRAQGRKVRQFVSSYGQKAKTDKIDAKTLLTIHEAEMQETLRLYQQDQSNQLKELVSRREDLKDMLQKERNRKEYFDDTKVAKRTFHRHNHWSITEAIRSYRARNQRTFGQERRTESKGRCYKFCEISRRKNYYVLVSRYA